MTQALRKTEQANHPVLPGRLMRDDAMKTLRKLRRELGITEARLEILNTMIESTRPSDWTDPSSEPICFARQTIIAERSGYSTRAVRECENALDTAGLLSKVTGADGSRGVFAGGEVVHGICFTPLIELMPQLLDLLDELDARRRHSEGLRRQCSAARRVLRRAVNRMLEVAPKASETEEALAAFASLPRRYDGLSEAELEDLLNTVDNAAAKALEFLELQKKSSGLPDSGVRLYIHDTTQDIYESCNASSVDKTPARKRADTDPSGDGPNGPSHCREKKDAGGEVSHKPQLTESFSPGQLYAIASENFRFYLDGLKGDRPFPNELIFIRTAIMMLPELGINHSAWDHAVDVMGELRAALSVLVIDARQYDTVRPIRSPGGSLRAFTDLDRQGRLNLAGSIIGLVERKRH